ncbi:type II toxin-antitoxin system VapB family antitoxin [bacterium]|nr:type II toxin-antitoxin system VapB family antitoxin [bacterium]
MRTNVTLDESLVRELQKLSGAKTKTAAVTQAVEEQIRRAKLKKLVSLFGHIQVDEEGLKRQAKADAERDRLISGKRGRRGR